MLPDSLRNEIEHRLQARITSSRSLSGGSINQAAHIKITAGGPCFLKWNRTADPEMFRKEVHGLNLLAGAESGLRIPEVLLQGTTEEEIGYLVLEFIAEGRPRQHSAQNFGEQLARLHSVRHRQFGLDVDNFIGRLPQQNSWQKSWTDFFIRQRIRPQLNMALDSGKLSGSVAKSFGRLFKKLPEIFPDEQASLLHGDLWGGNYFYDENGDAVIFDPAVYYGHREIEIAFTHLFGGFSSAFYQAYEQVLPLEANFEKRKDVYNLYPLLVHTNLFGGSYARQVEEIVKRFR